MVAPFAEFALKQSKSSIEIHTAQVNQRTAGRLDLVLERQCMTSGGRSESAATAGRGLLRQRLGHPFVLEFVALFEFQ